MKLINGNIIIIHYTLICVCIFCILLTYNKIVITYRLPIDNTIVDYTPTTHVLTPARPPNLQLHHITS